MYRELINELLDEEQTDETKGLKEYERTRLKPSIQLFEKFLTDLDGSRKPKEKKILASGKKI